MSKLPPSASDAPEGEPGPRVIGDDTDANADELVSALSSETSRRLLAALHEDPDTASGVAERIDTTVRDARHHLARLSAAGAVEVVEVDDSEESREANVYAPADRQLVVYAGDERGGDGSEAASRRLLGAAGLLALAGVAVQAATANAGSGAAVAPGPAPGIVFFLGGLFALGLAAAVRYARTRAE